MQLLLLLVLGAATMALFVRFSRSYSAESAQLLNWGLGAELATSVTPFVTGGVDYVGLEKRFFDITTLNPRIRIFLLDHTGRILFSSTDHALLARDSVAIEPVERFLTALYGTKTPLVGDDPATPAGKTIFSAATVPINHEKGYLYVLLDSGTSSAIAGVLESSYLARSSGLLFLLALLLTGVLAMVTISFLTKPLTGMTEAVKMLETGDYSRRVDYARNDELGMLARAYNSMADTLIDSMQQLAHTDRLRRELVANVAHDLRGPLTVAFGYLETITLRDIPLTDAARDKAIDAAARNVRSLCRLVDSLFELAAIEARDTAPQLKRIGLEDFFASLSLRFEQTATEAGVTIRTILPGSHCQILGDPGLLERALSNLIDNAIKYSPRGTAIELSADEVSAAAALRIRVRDTGPGIPSEDLERIFESFYRGAGATTGQPGTGLGLAIAQRIVKLHGSKLQVESTVGLGSCFFFDLPPCPAEHHLPS